MSEPYSLIQHCSLLISLLLHFIFTRPQNMRELFNRRHSSLRNIIERLFGIWKKRFPILTSAPQYDIRTQAKLVVALAVLHNFIVEAGGNNDDIALEWDREERDRHHPCPVQEDTGNEPRTDMTLKREVIGGRMWEEYSAISDRGERRTR